MDPRSLSPLTRRLRASLLGSLMALTLLGCGGGGGGGDSAPAAPAPPPPPPLGANADPSILAEQRAELAALPADETLAPNAVPVLMPTRSAVRFLNQATFGATDADIESVRTEWRTGWLARQFAMPVSKTHWDHVDADTAAWLADDSTRTANNTPQAVWDWSVWQAYITSPDQLRRRAGYALSQIMVVSTASLGVANNNPRVAAGYLDLLEKGAFGNFRQLLEDVSLSRAMGVFLSHRGNRKAEYDSNGVAVRVPDENYAREVMQLFTLGTVELESTGKVRLKDGKPVETYTQDDVSNLARVFTGWDLEPGSATDIERYRKPMRHIAANHSPEEKKFLGTTIPANTPGPESLRLALDTLFNHPNVGPFIGKQLIQRLVTSNPSEAYVKRVADRFNNNGAGVRGDMKAVFTQVLNDEEARSPTLIDSPPPGWGKVREPVLRFTQLARHLKPVNSGEIWFIGSQSSSQQLGQSPLRAETVFNFYDSAYTPPKTALAAQKLVAPELGIVNEVSLPATVNTLQRFMSTPPVRMTLDFSRGLELANTPTALVAELNLRLANDSLSAATRSEIVATVTALPSATAADRLTRVRTALLMLMAAPDFIVQK